MVYTTTPVQTGRTARENCRGKRTTAFHGRDQILVTQLTVCLLLFLAVFMGKGIFPNKIAEIRQDALALMSTDIDLRGGIAQILSVTGKEDAFQALCAAIFGADEDTKAAPAALSDGSVGADVLEQEIKRLGNVASVKSETTHHRENTYSALGLVLQEPEPPEEPIEEAVVETEPTVPAAGTVILKVEGTGRALPKHYTLDQLSLGELETVTPVLGHLNSAYGYRDHPINGVYQFHGGVDIGGQKGDAILAFSSGTVEYIGEDKSYGLYLQLDHGNGVKSFYAHCSRLLVKKGDHVVAGDKIAEVGSSGSATGPHLHLELKYGQMHIDPAYYLDFLTT